jgi:hypothetical protein
MVLRRYRPIALAMLILHLCGCTPWQPASVGPVGSGRLEEPVVAPVESSPRHSAQAPLSALRVQQVDEDAFWSWVWDQKWYIAVGALIVAAAVVLTWRDDCSPVDQYGVDQYCRE